MTEDLVQAIRDQKVILFVGAGVSMNLGLPSFAGLVDHLAVELGYDPALFRLSGDYLSLAEYYQLEKGPIGPLRSWMDVTWHSSNIDISKSAIHQRIVQLRPTLIYTTNYDRWLEHAFTYHHVPYIKVANVGDLVNTKDGTTQIVKFHGDFDDDDSIVLTESSYFDRLSFESPLDIKLRADALGKTLLFIGYNLADINLRYLFYKLHKQWETSEHKEVRPRSFIFLSRPNAIQERVLRSRGISPLVSSSDDPGLGLLNFLEGLVAAAFGLS